MSDHSVAIDIMHVGIQQIQILKHFVLFTFTKVWLPYIHKPGAIDLCDLNSPGFVPQIFVPRIDSAWKETKTNI